VKGEVIWQETKGFIEQKQEEIRRLTDDCARIEQKNYQISNKAREAKQLAENLSRVKKEKEDIEKIITSFTTSPFLEDKKSGETLAEQRARLDALLVGIEKECKKSKSEEFT
jgi:SOS response regulatory protein OraA/RecX